MADKGDHPGVHIDPTDFYKDLKQEDKNVKDTEKGLNRENKNVNPESKEGEKFRSDKPQDKNLGKEKNI